MATTTLGNRFYGREAELKLLHRLQADVRDRGISRFVVVTGRRRIGKTRLIEEALPGSDSMPTISTYIASQLSSTNLVDFVAEIQSALSIPYPLAVTTWEDALALVFHEAQRRPLTLVFDEFQNFRTVAPTIFDTLQKLWDRWHTKSKILIVTCGSDAGSMREIFENGTAPLFARESAFIRLSPFQPDLLKEIFADYKADFTGDDLLALYAFTGGVAQYVQTFLSSGAFTFEAMLRHAVQFNSGFISEAQLMIAAEFKGHASVMNEILMAIAKGSNKRAELVSMFDVDISGHLFKLEQFYGLIETVEPVGLNGAKRKRARYELTDELLNFWYTFCLPHYKMLQSNRTDALQEAIRFGYLSWSGRVLKRLYRRHFMNLGQFTTVGPWWDKDGSNEIDLVAINSVTKRITFAEIKRNADKIDLHRLALKTEHFFHFNPQYRQYEKQYTALSLSELSSSTALPMQQTF